MDVGNRDKILSIRMTHELWQASRDVADSLGLSVSQVFNLALHAELVNPTGVFAKLSFKRGGRWLGEGLPPLAWFEELDAEAKDQEAV